MITQAELLETIIWVLIDEGSVRRFAKRHGGKKFLGAWIFPDGSIWLPKPKEVV